MLWLDQTIWLLLLEDVLQPGSSENLERIKVYYLSDLEVTRCTWDPVGRSGVERRLEILGPGFCFCWG